MNCNRGYRSFGGVKYAFEYEGTDFMRIVYCAYYCGNVY